MPSPQSGADFAGPLAYSCSNAQGVAVTVDAVYAILSGSQLKLFDDTAGPTSSLATSTSIIELQDFAGCLAGPAQQGLTWELTLQRRHNTNITAKAEQESHHPRDGRRKSTVAGLENKKNWLKSKLRSKSISTSASANSLAALAQDDPPPPVPSTSTAAVTSTAAATPATANTPTRRLSIHTSARFTRSGNASSSAVTPNKGSVILSTISKDMQQKWIAAISGAIASNTAPILLPSASSPSSLSNLAAYRMPRTQSPSPLTTATTAASQEQSPSFLEVEPPSPRLFTFQETAGEATSKQLDRRSSSPVNPFLPQWLADVRNATNKNGDSSARSFGMRPSRSSNALLSKAAGAGDAAAGVSIAISHHEESSDPSSKGGKKAALPTRPSTANTLSPPALRPQRSSSSLSSSSRLDESICSTAPSTNPPTPKAFNDSPPNNRQTMCFGEKNAVAPSASSKGGWRRGFGFSSSDEEGRTSLGSLTSATSDQSTTTTTTTSAAFETPRRHGSDGDTAPIGSHIIEPAELRRRMLERGVLLDARPSTASGNIGDIRKKSTFGPGARLPAAPLPPTTPGEKVVPPHQQYNKPEGLDVQALFAALPPPKKRSTTGHHLSGMKTSSSSGSINSLTRSRAVVTLTSPSSNSSNSPVHSPLAL